MPTLKRDTLLTADLARVFDFFSDPNNLTRITPPSLGFRIIEAPSRRLRAGDRIEYRIRVLGVPVRWVTRITEWREGVRFADEQETGPYRRWRHVHEFETVPEGVLMKDTVDYELLFPPFGGLVAGWWVRRQLREIFDYRAEVITSIALS